MMNDSVETTGEAGGRHPEPHTVNEEAGHIVFHTEHVEHDMNDDTVERTPTETMLNDAVEAAGGTGEEHSERSTVNEESGHIVGEEHHARCAHSDEEAGSIVLHVSTDMNEKKTDDDEAGETAAAKETEEISKEDVDIRRLEEKKHTQRRETAPERSEQMQ